MGRWQYSVHCSIHFSLNSPERKLAGVDMSLMLDWVRGKGLEEGGVGAEAPARESGWIGC